MMFEDQDLDVQCEGMPNQYEQMLTHRCFVCGDTIDLSLQVCSRFCLQALGDMDLMDNLEAQVLTTPTPTTLPPVFTEHQAQEATLTLTQ